MSTSGSKTLPKSIFVGVGNNSLWPGEGRARVCLALRIADGEEELPLSPCPLPTLSGLGVDALQEHRVRPGSAGSWVSHGTHLHVTHPRAKPSSRLTFGAGCTRGQILSFHEMSRL